MLDNLTSVTAPSTAAHGSHAYCYDANNRLTNIKVASCSGATVVGLGYDVQGNLVNKNGTVYNFDYGNRLRSVSGLEGYRYDALGRRVLAWSPTSSNILSIYTRSGQLAFQQNQRGNYRNLDYVYLGRSLVAIREQDVATGVAAVTYQHTDALGSPVAMTNVTRTVVERSKYEPYGYLLNRPMSDGPGYTGHVSDAATGLVYMQQRYYDEELGRFLSVDPVTVLKGGPQHFNLYGYAYNNPYTFTDPDGRCPWCAGAAGGAIIGAFAGGLTSFASSGGDFRATVAGTIGGAVGGAIAGASLGAASGVGASTGAAIASAIAGDAASQVTENVIEHAADTASYTYDIEQAVLAGTLGAPLGPAAVLVDEVAGSALTKMEKQLIPAALGILIQIPAVLATEENNSESPHPELPLNNEDQLD